MIILCIIISNLEEGYNYDSHQLLFILLSSLTLSYQWRKREFIGHMYVCKCSTVTISVTVRECYYMVVVVLLDQCCNNVKQCETVTQLLFWQIPIRSHVSLSSICLLGQSHLLSLCVKNGRLLPTICNTVTCMSMSHGCYMITIEPPIPFIKLHFK